MDSSCSSRVVEMAKLSGIQGLVKIEAGMPHNGGTSMQAPDVLKGRIKLLITESEGC